MSLSCRSRGAVLLALWTFVVSPLVTSVVASPDVDGWVQKVQLQRLNLADVEGGQRELAAKKAFFELRKDHPVLVDWVLQDANPNGFKVLMPDGGREVETQLLQKVGVTKAPDSTNERFRLYVEHCQQRREKRLRSVLQKWAPFAFTETHSNYATFIGYTEGLSDPRFERFFKPGGRLTVLHFDEGSTHGRPEHLIEDEYGMMRDVDVSFDLSRLLFAWKKSDKLDDYHVYEYNLSQRKSRQLTYGLGRADFEPIYLPDGDIIFASTRPEQSVPCWWNEIANLYRMNPDGRYIRRLAVDQVQTMYPQVLNNGQVSYTRWDYSDRGQVYTHPVFVMNPDGQAQRAFYGMNSWFPNSLLHTRSIPGSHKVMAVASGHHTQQRGKLVMIDVALGRNEGEGMRFIAPVRDVPYERVDAAQQHGDQFRYPFPLSETEFLISYVPNWGYEPDAKALMGESSGNNIIKTPRYADLSDYSLYWMNADGEREYLYGDRDLAIQRPVALGYKPTQPVIPDTVDYTKDTGTLLVHDVHVGEGLKGIPRGEAKKIRVVRLNYRAAGIGLTQNEGEGGLSMNSTPVSIGNGTWDVKEIIGDADIHSDGSAYFEVPADESIYIQVLNGRGEVIQTTRSWDTVRPGEQKTCVSCHAKPGTDYPVAKEDTLAWKHGVQTLEPFYGPTRGFSFQNEIQPILDASCVTCHDGTEDGVMDLRGDLVDGNTQNKRRWSRSYVNLTGAEIDKYGGYTADHPEEGIVTWISKMSRPTDIPPYFSGAAKSPLLKILNEGHYDVQLSEESYHKFAAWMDLLVPFSGTYREAHAWSEPEMRKYNYYEAKRRAQYQEEVQNIADFLAQLETTPKGLKDTAPFTRANYDSVWVSDGFPLTGGQGLQIGSDEPFVFDRISLRVESDHPVSLQLRKGADIIHTFSLKAGGDSAIWDAGGKVYRNRDVQLWVDQSMSLASIEVRGIPEKDLPEWEGYKPHLH